MKKNRCRTWLLGQNGAMHDLGLLLLRLSVGLMMAFSHGLGKFQQLLQGGEIAWADPIGIGAAPSLFLAASAEFLCSLALILGLLTRLVTIPLMITMAVAVFIVHANDPFIKQEFALLYLTVYLALWLMGPGRFSLDAWFSKKLTKLA